jgi:hypothetical protein
VRVDVCALVRIDGRSRREERRWWGRTGEGQRIVVKFGATRGVWRTFHSSRPWRACGVVVWQSMAGRRTGEHHTPHHTRAGLDQSGSGGGVAAAAVVVIVVCVYGGGGGGGAHARKDIVESSPNLAGRQSLVLEVCNPAMRATNSGGCTQVRTTNDDTACT